MVMGAHCFNTWHLDPTWLKPPSLHWLFSQTVPISALSLEMKTKPEKKHSGGREGATPPPCSLPSDERKLRKSQARKSQARETSRVGSVETGCLSVKWGSIISLGCGEIKG